MLRPAFTVTSPCRKGTNRRFDADRPRSSGQALIQSAPSAVWQRTSGRYAEQEREPRLHSDVGRAACVKRLRQSCHHS